MVRQLVNLSDQSLFIAWGGGWWWGFGGFWGESHGFQGYEGEISRR